MESWQPPGPPQVVSRPPDAWQTEPLADSQHPAANVQRGLADRLTPAAEEPPTNEPPADGPTAGETPATQGRASSRRRSRSDIRLADLLTEALMAYQNVRDTESDPATGLDPDSSSGLPGPTSVPDPLAVTFDLDPAVGAEPPPPGMSRHRGEDRPGNQRRNAPRWDPQSD